MPGIETSYLFIMEHGKKQSAVNLVFRSILVVFQVVMLPLTGITQPDTTNIYDLDFEELARLKITSASKVSQSLDEVSTTVYVVTAREIEARGYLTLEEALSDLPGFQFRNIQSINSYVFQRGIPNQNNLMLVLIDGVQVNELNSGGFYGGGQYNLSNVERIEVIHGPSSVIYGTNAVSGIVNILTKNHGRNHIRASMLAGSFNTIKSDFSISQVHTEKPRSISFSGMIKSSQRSDLKEEAGDFNWSALMDNFERDYAFDVKLKAGRFSWGTNYLHKQSSTAAYEKASGTAYRDYGSLWNIRFLNNQLRYAGKISDKLSLSAALYNRNATVLDNTVAYVLDTAQIGYYRPNYLLGAENVFDISISPSFSLTAGLVFEYEQLAESYSVTYSDGPDQRPPKPNKPEMLSNTLASIFAEPRIQPFKNLFLSGGFRFDQSSIYQQRMTPRAGLSYQAGRYAFRFSYAEAFRAPKPWDYYAGLGNDALVPENMKSMEAGIGVLFSDKIRADILAYHNILDHAISRENLPDGFRWVNMGKIKTQGLEFVMKYHTEGFSSYLNYTFNDSRDKWSMPVFEISKHVGNLGFSYSFREMFLFSIRANYVGERKNPRQISASGNNIIDPYLIFHTSLALIGYNNFDFQLTVKNLLDKEYYHSSNRTPERYRQPQRTILFSISYKLID